jgi:hypothetical protein
MRPQSVFTCTCYDPDLEIGASVTIPSYQLKEHRKRCDKMSNKYGILYDEWERITEDGVKNENIEEWRNMRAIYEHFRGRFIEEI